MARTLCIALLLWGGAAWADGAAVDDARLGASAAAVHATLDRAGQAGLPADLLADKVREGLAKGVAPARSAARAPRRSRSSVAHRRRGCSRRSSRRTPPAPARPTWRRSCARAAAS